jgi:beta-glucanase (GH16 family)
VGDRGKLYYRIIIAVGIMLPILMVQAFPHPIGTTAPALASGWVLKFHDEFNGTELNRTKWSTTFPWGARTNGANHELEYYTDTAFQVANGMLRIRANRHSTHGFRYTSGIITSYASFNLTYGYLEVRAQVPKGVGLWPAVWLATHDESWPPEIDLMEIQGNNTVMNHMTTHYSDAAGPEQKQYGWAGPDFSKGFHTFGLQWTPSQLTWYVDGIQRFRTSIGVPDKPMYVIANLAVGGDWVGPPNAKTAFPASLKLAYIRVYQRP